MNYKCVLYSIFWGHTCQWNLPFLSWARQTSLGGNIMADSYFFGQTLDDVMRSVVEEIQSNGERINPSKGECTELRGVLIELTDPRARLSRTETRGKPFSCVGELCWYLARTNELEFVSYYLPYSEYADGNLVLGGYGPRLFNW